MDGLQLRTLYKDSGDLELTLAKVPVTEPGPDEVTVMVEATPINPSDIGLLFGAADMKNAKFSGSGADTKIVTPMPKALRRAMAARAGLSLPAGNEGAGTVVATDTNTKHLMGKTVAILG